MTSEEAYRTARDPFTCPVCQSAPMHVRQLLTTKLSPRVPEHDRLEDRHLEWSCQNLACGWKEIGPPII